MRTTYITIAIASLIALGTLVYGFTLVGSPSTARALQFDSTRVSNLRSLDSSIQSYYYKNNKLPASLSDLDTTSYSYNSSGITKDPETKKTYDYKTTGSTSYQLCATFSTDSSKNKQNSRYYYYYTDSEFNHPKGNKCFDLTVTSYSKTTYTQTKSTTIEDSKIDSVTTDTLATNTGNFPYGFFSTNSSEWGMIVSTSNDVSVTIDFKAATKISSISNTFTSCAKDNCYTWSAKGIANGKTVDLVAATSTNSNYTSKQTVSSTEALSSVTITAKRADGGSYLYWKKIKIEYAQ